jgi:hypothetical protein
MLENNEVYEPEPAPEWQSDPTWGRGDDPRMTGPLAEAARRALEAEEEAWDSECPPGIEPAPEAAPEPTPAPQGGASAWWGRQGGQ